MLIALCVFLVFFGCIISLYGVLRESDEFVCVGFLIISLSSNVGIFSVLYKALLE